ncbi:MAG: acetate/propionate family kinase [Verrucomicrobiota bacterium JB022]|nr:acetate/propionate family kinase [Verrucomicrobiota bacterium JB022]
MKILVANLGSTSYKYTLFNATATGLDAVAKGKYERVEDHGLVIEHSLQALIDEGHLASLDELAAVGFKTVMGGDVTGCRLADDTVLEALERTAPLAPAHNPPYAAGIRQFARLAPKATHVVLFETAFYQWVAPVAKRYAVPQAWYEAGVRRYGFHGASHKFIAERSAELLGRADIVERVQSLYAGKPEELPAFEGQPLRVISCHLGGSSSVTAIRNGTAIGTSMGFSPQSGLPQNNRVGDLDAMAIPFALRQLGLSLDEVDRQLTKQSGLLGVSGLSNDIRDLKDAAAQGHADAQTALDLLNHEIRRWASSFLFDLNGLDAIAFTGGIGEFNPDVRAAVCRSLEFLGLELDAAANEACLGAEAVISTAASKVKVLVIPANEEAVIATETQRFLQRRKH